MTKTSTSRIALMLPLVLAGSAWADAVPAPEGMDVIVVTARRRTENLEKVPIAVQAIRPEEIAERGIVTEQDLVLAVPGLSIAANTNSNNFNYQLRGQSVDTYTGSPPAVLTYIDEAPIAFHSQSAYYDLGGIQVLKGPQGTLFGRNTTGGAILYDTAKPNGQFGGYVDVRYGNYNAGHVDAAVNIPIDEKVDLRIAGSYTGGGGYIHNIYNGQWLGDQDNKSLRATLVLKPIDGLTNTTVFSVTDEGGTNGGDLQGLGYACGMTFPGTSIPPLKGLATPCALSPSNPVFAAYVAAHPNVPAGGFLYFQKWQSQVGPWVVDLDSPTTHAAHSIYAIDTTTYEISPSATIKNIISFNDNRSVDQIDYDGMPYPFTSTSEINAADQSVGPSGYNVGTRSYSEELQLQGKLLDERLTYVTGLFYDNERTFTNSVLGVYLLFPFGGPYAHGVFVDFHTEARDESVAGFAQATYKLLDNLNVTGGIRYTAEDQSIRQEPGSRFFGAPQEKTNASNPSWVFGLDYQPTPNLLLYVTTRGSWRTGGYNFSTTPLNTVASGGGNQFLPETSEDVEIGAKYQGQDLGMPVTLNVDAYNQWTTNVQRSAYLAEGSGSTAVTTLVTVNVPSGEVSGFELSGSVRPVPWLTLGANGAYTYARYTNGAIAVTLANTLTALNYGPPADVSRFSGGLYGEIFLPLPGDEGALTLHVDVFGQTHQPFSNLTGTVNPYDFLGGYSLTNARLTWSQVLGTDLDASVYVRNLFNRRYYIGGNAAGDSSGNNGLVGGLPRFYGVELKYTF